MNYFDVNNEIVEGVVNKLTSQLLDMLYVMYSLCQTCAHVLEQSVGLPYMCNLQPVIEITITNHTVD